MTDICVMNVTFSHSIYLDFEVITSLLNYLPSLLQFRLIHFNSSTALKFSGRQLPEWGFQQHEIVTDKVIDQEDTIWNVEEHRYSRSKSKLLCGILKYNSICNLFIINLLMHFNFGSTSSYYHPYSVCSRLAVTILYHLSS